MVFSPYTILYFLEDLYILHISLMSYNCVLIK